LIAAALAKTFTHVGKGCCNQSSWLSFKHNSSLLILILGGAKVKKKGYVII
jgi:hypothetical protein